MSKHKVGLNGAHEDEADHGAASVQQDGTDRAANESIAGDGVKSAGADAMTVAATLGVVVIGAAVLEAALIPGILVGAAAAFAPKFVPKLGERLQPLFNSTVRGACKLGRKARSAYGEAQERIHDIAAEVHAEETAKASESVA